MKAVLICLVAQALTSVEPRYAPRFDLDQALAWTRPHLDQTRFQESIAPRALQTDLSLAGQDSILEEDFCPMYYWGDGDCEALKLQVKFNHTLTQPTLELGDPSNPVMFFFHGWPDTGGVWANQFEYFCMPPNGKFYCVAPTWTDFHPDFETATREQHFIDLQTDRMHRTAQELGLKDMVLVIFDWGSALGYQYMYKYPEMVTKVISFDIGDSPIMPGTKQRATGDAMISSLPQYQQDNIRAYRTNDFSHMQALLQSLKMAVWRGHEPSFFQARTGWPYNCMVLDGEGEEMSERLAPDVPFDQWKFDYVPDYPAGIPILFLYGKCQDGTGCPECAVPSCQDRSMKFHDDAWETWVNERNGSKVVAINAGHWMMLQQSVYTNKVMEAWLEGNEVPTQNASESDSGGGTAATCDVCQGKDIDRDGDTEHGKCGMVLDYCFANSAQTEECGGCSGMIHFHQSSGCCVDEKTTLTTTTSTETTTTNIFTEIHMTSTTSCCADDQTTSTTIEPTEVIFASKAYPRYMSLTTLALLLVPGLGN